VTATSAKPTMMTSPSNVVRTVSSWRTAASRYRRRGRAVASPRSLTSPCAPVTTLIADSSIPDARIDRDVGDVGEEIDDQVDDRRDEDRSLGDRCVAVADPLDRKLAHPRVREDVLDDEGAGKQGTGLEADDRDQRDQRIAQCVSQRNAPGR